MRLPCLVLLAALAASASAQGRLEFDTQDHEFGRLTEWELGRHSFTFTNSGDQPLELVDVESNCGCTVPSYTPGVVAPGRAGEVTIVYDTRGRPGPFEKAVRVTTDQGQAVTLRISGVVEPAFITTGEAIGNLFFETLTKRVSFIDQSAPLQTSVQFANFGVLPIRVERVVASQPGVDVVFPRGPVFPDHVGGLFVTMEDPRPLVRYGESVELVLMIYTTDTDEPVKRVTIRPEVFRPDSRDG